MSTPDISRHLFQPEKRYTGAFMQQGRVVTDEDLNAHRRLHAEDERRTFRDIICAKGSPNHGFRISALEPASYDFAIESGSFYIGGRRFEADPGQPETFLTQRDWLQIDLDPMALPQAPTVADLTTNSGTIDRFDLVYLRAWEQCVSAVEDRELIEVALGGPDTSVYERRHRRVEVLAGVPGECPSAFQELIDSITEGGHAFDSASCELIPAARLTVGFSGETPSDDLCQPAVLQGYLGAENQAIRVQLTASDRFIWGFDNASPLYRVQIGVDANGDATEVRFLTLPHDEFAQPVSGQAVEILPWGALLPNGEKAAEWQGHLTTVATSFDPATGRITIANGIPQAWLNWLNDPGHAGFLNPRDEPEAQRYFYLRVWTGGSGNAAQPDHVFTPGTAVPLAGTGLQATFSAAGVPGLFWVIAARPHTPDELVPWSLTDNASAFGWRQFFAPLALIRWRIVSGEVVGGVIDCRSRFRPLCQLKGCCTIIVGDGSTSHGEFVSIGDAVAALPPAGGEICVLRGRFEEHIRIDGRSNIKIRGCGRETLIVAQNETPVFDITDSSRIEIADLAIEAPAAPGISCRATDPDRVVQNIVLARLSISSRDMNSIAVFRGRSVAIVHNEVRVLELADPLRAEGSLGRQSAIFLHGEDILVESNRITADEGERSAQRGYGGLHIGGGSRRVEIRRNLIRGGNNNGITLGHSVAGRVEAPRPGDLTIGSDAFLGLTFSISAFGCIIIDPFPPQPPEGGNGGGTVFDAGPALHDIRIVDNDIERMGMSGIAVQRFFDLEENRDFITVERLTIEQNRITRCVQLEIGPVPFPLRDIIAFGGIALADIDEFLIVRGNTIANNGQSSVDPVCGIFVLHGEGIAIEGNRILHNGMPLDIRDQPRPGRRGGVVLAFARARALDSLSVAIFDRSISGLRQDGVPAARVHDNIVVAHQGRALEIIALGPVSVADNQLTAKGSNSLNRIPLPGRRFAGGTTLAASNIAVSQSRGSIAAGNPKSPTAAADVPITGRKDTTNPFLAFLDVLGGAVVSIFNLGVSNELYFQLAGLSGLFLLDKLPTREASEEDDDVRFFIGGNILFNDNQVVLDALGPTETFVVSSVFLGCLDDISMNANQCDCDLGRDAVLTNTLTIGFSQKMADNRFKEGLFNALFSGASLAFMNTTTDNQGTHCFLPVFPPAAARLAHIAGNRSLVQLNPDVRCAGNDLRDQLGNQLPSPGSLASPQVSALFPAADRLRLVALDRTEAFAGAKTTSLSRELRVLQALQPEGSPEIRQAMQRVDVQQRFAVQTTAEIQRGEVAIPARNPGALVLYGRVVADRGRIGQKGLVVSVVGADGNASAFTCTDGNGAFRLEVPVPPRDATVAVTLLVSDTSQTILSRGTEVFPVAGDKVVYREIVLSGEPGKPAPTPPPPVPERVEVPAVVGRERSSAIQLLQRVGLLATIEETEADGENVGLVVAQDPAGGVSVGAGSSVKITVGIAGKTVPVPGVTGQTLANAAAILKRAQLNVGTVDPPNPGNDGLVLAQMPEAGTQAERGSAVDLKVQPPVLEPPTVTVPDVVRLTVDEARETLNESKLKLGEITFQRTAENQVGRVLSQTPNRDSKVAPGSEVALLVGERESGNPPGRRSPAEIIRDVAQEPDFERIGFTEARLQRALEGAEIETADDLLELARSEDPAVVRDRFRLRNLDQARALQEILLRVLERG